MVNQRAIMPYMGTLSNQGGKDAVALPVMA
jgi:hypothetical protein